MAKIVKVPQNLFGEDGTLSFFGQFGSKAQTGTGVNTQDPATIQSLQAFKDGLESAVLNGSKPAIEDMNSLFLLAFRQVAYLIQAGIAEWDTTTVYYIGSIVQVSGVAYISKTDTNSGNNPATDSTNWGRYVNEDVGIVKDFAGVSANIPDGYLECDGSAISRATYAELFASIGTQWGVGDGSTTFNLPDLQGLVTAGYNSGDSDFNSVGKTGGAKTHTLTVAQVPNLNISLAGRNANGWNLTDNYVQGSNNSGGSGSITSATTNGGGGSHPIVQPYGTMLKIIKY